MSVMRVVLESVRAAKVRWLVLLGVLGLTAGAGLLNAAAALALTGSEPGNLTFRPATGATTLTPTWSTKDGCPAGFQVTAVLFALNTDGSVGTSASPTVANVTSAFSGFLPGPIGKVISLGTNVRSGGTSEFVVGCFAGKAGTGAVSYVQAEWVTLSANGSTYTTSNTPPASTSPTSTPTGTPTPTPTSTLAPSGTSSSATPGSTGVPSGAPAAGAGGAAPSGDGSNVLNAVGAVFLAGSAAAMGLAIRRARRLPGESGPGRGKPGGS